MPHTRSLYLRLRIAACFAGVAMTAVATPYVEHWDTSPPANNGWFYFDPDGGGDGDIAPTWKATGGWLDSGYLETDLGELGPWTPTGGLFYPLYTYGSHGSYIVHPIALTETPKISLAINDLTVGGNANLQGGQLRFWIGEWSDPDGEGPLGPLYSFYYYNAKALAVADGWNLRSVKVTPDDGAWTEISDNQDKSAADLFVNPQQWGIGLVGATAAPTGLLGFDEFATIVPEPGTLALAALAALAWLQRPRPGRRPRR